MVLSMDVICSCDCRVPCLTSMPKSITSTLDNSTLPERPAKAVLVTLGLFSIIQMERDVQMTIPAYDYCIPERECNCNTANPAKPSPALTFRWMSSSPGIKRTAALAARTAATPAPIPPTIVTIAKIQKAPLTVPAGGVFLVFHCSFNQEVRPVLILAVFECNFVTHPIRPQAPFQDGHGIAVFALFHTITANRRQRRDFQTFFQGQIRRPVIQLWA